MPDTNNYNIPNLYNNLWVAFTAGYGAHTDIPTTYLQDLYPWFGNHKILRDHLDTIFHTAPYTAGIHLLLSRMYTLAHNVHVPRSGRGHRTDDHLIWLTDSGSVHAHGNAKDIHGYIALDRFIDSLDIVVSATAFNLYDPHHAAFLRHPSNITLFKELGAFLGANAHHLTSEVSTGKLPG